MKYITRKERNHILRNKPFCLQGIKHDLRIIKKNLSYWPQKVIYEKLEHLESELERHAKDLDYLGKQWSND